MSGIILNQVKVGIANNIKLSVLANCQQCPPYKKLRQLTITYEFC